MDEAKEIWTVLPPGIPILFVIKVIQRSGEGSGKLAELPSSVFYLGKGSISLWSVLHSGFSSVSQCLVAVASSCFR